MLNTAKHFMHVYAWCSLKSVQWLILRQTLGCHHTHKSTAEHEQISIWCLCVIDFPFVLCLSVQHLLTPISHLLDFSLNAVSRRFEYQVSPNGDFLLCFLWCRTSHFVASLCLVGGCLCCPHGIRKEITVRAYQDAGEFLYVCACACVRACMHACVCVCFFFSREHFVLIL